MEDKEIMDQAQLAQSVSDQIKYTFLDYFLVKPLDPIKVKKEFSKPVSTGTPVEDANGVKAEDFDTVETEVKEVNSDYRKGVVIKLPLYYTVAPFSTNLRDNCNTLSSIDENNPTKINVGDIVIFRDAAGLRFDLVKDSRLLRQYDILGIEK